MKVYLLLMVLVFSSVLCSSSNFTLYAINPFSLSKTASSHPSILPFGLRTLNPQDIHIGPILILTPKFEEQPNTKILYAFFVPNGMSSLRSNTNFENLYNSFLEFRLSGIVLFPGIYSRRILAQSSIVNVTSPDAFKATDLLRFIDNPTIPVVFIAPTEVFINQFSLPLNHFSSFTFQKDGVVLSKAFGTFYYPIDEGNVGPVSLEILNTSNS